MSGLLKKIARAAVAQPWDYMGEGAPNEWEFRVAPDGSAAAFYNPDIGEWIVFKDVTVDSRVPVKRTDRELGDWPRFVEDLSDEEK